MSTNLHKITRPKRRVTIDIEGENVTVEEVAVRHFDKFIEIVEVIAPKIQDEDFETLIRSHATQLIELASICSGKDLSFCEALSISQLDEMLSAVFDVNRDFFLQAAMKAITVAAQK